MFDFNYFLGLRVVRNKLEGEVWYYLYFEENYFLWVKCKDDMEDICSGFGILIN